jgi:hypothetical protein
MEPIPLHVDFQISVPVEFYVLCAALLGLVLTLNMYVCVRMFTRVPSCSDAR